ncbi:hypothetical protein [Arcobacter vandammei]|uniref:hypothetical protein n=1 Tax=Arcobacter vandammei TaxID=2782243 RepID=UPI0018E02851|nr:hypothetical protein [Arcobacter vandammei]
MKKKSIIIKESEINVSLLSKIQKNIYNKILSKYRFWETYDFLKLIYKNEVYFSDIFMKDIFYILIKINEYTDKVMSVHHYTYFPRYGDCSLTVAVIQINSAVCKILEAIVLKKYVLTIHELEKLIFASLLIFLDKSFYHCRFKYPSILHKYTEDKIINKYINVINSKSDNFEFISNILESELKNEAEILKNNPKLLRILNSKKNIYKSNIF